MRVRDENEFSPEWDNDRYNVEVTIMINIKNTKVSKVFKYFKASYSRLEKVKLGLCSV